MTATQREWRSGREAARAASDPVTGPGDDGRAEDDPTRRADRAIHAFDPAHVADWDSDLPFDLAGYYHEPRRVEMGEDRLAALTRAPLAPGDLAALRMLRDAEADAVRLLRDLLVTPINAEARVTAFLTTWAFEQHWVARALEAVLDASGVAWGTDAPAGPVAVARRAFEDRTRPIALAVRANALGEDVVALQMVHGLLDARSLEAAYGRLAARADRTNNPELARMCREIAEIKAVHADFHGLQARARLERSAAARSLVRAWLAAGRWRWPGTRYAGRDMVGEALRDLLRGPEGRAAIEGVDADVRGILVAAGMGTGAGVGSRDGFAPVARHLRRYGFGQAAPRRAARRRA